MEPKRRENRIAEIVQLAIQSGRRHVVLTGGEPLLPPESVQLCEQLRHPDCI